MKGKKKKKENYGHMYRGLKKKSDYERKSEAGKRALGRAIRKEKQDRQFGYSDKEGSIGPMSDNKDRWDVKDVVKHVHKGINDLKKSDARKRSKKTY